MLAAATDVKLDNVSRDFMKILVDTRYLNKVPDFFGAKNCDLFLVTDAGEYYLEDHKIIRGFDFSIPTYFNHCIEILKQDNLCEIINSTINFKSNFELNQKSQFVYESIINYIERDKQFILFTDDENLINICNKNKIETIQSINFYSEIGVSNKMIESINHNLKIYRLNYDVSSLRAILLLILATIIILTYLILTLNHEKINAFSFLYAFFGLAISYAFYHFKLWNRMIWGVTEIVVGFLNSAFVFNIIINKQEATYLSIFQLIAGIFLIMKGLENVDTSENSKWFNKFILRDLKKRKLK